VLRAITTIQTFLISRHQRHADPERGQATAEYALVLLGAATIALLLLAWATKSGRVGKLFESVFDAVTDKL
jgi:Flp pilus assembly pilin Flp